MARKLRVDPNHGWHHVMNRGVDRQRIFFDDDDRIEFGRCVALACRRFDVELHAYCLMDNHFHLLLRCPSGHVSEMMHLACGLYARHVNSRHGRVGHLFGDRFCSRLVTSVAYIVNAVRYIHRNPLDINGVSEPASYRWSSHKMYLGSRRTPDFMRTDVVLSWFASPAGFDNFVGRRPDRHQARPADTIHLDTATAMPAIDLVIDERSLVSGRAVLTQRRAIAFSIASRWGDHAGAQLLDDLGFHSPSSRRAAIWRTNQHLERMPETSMLIDPVLELIAPPPAWAIAS